MRSARNDYHALDHQMNTYSMPNRIDAGAYPSRAGVFGIVARRAPRRMLEAYVLFPVFAILLLAVVWTAVLHLIAAEGAAAMSAALESSRELADTYQAQMVRNLVAIDQTLKTVKYASELKGGEALADLQTKGLLPSAMIFEVAIIGRNGAVKAATQAQMPANVGGQDYFIAQRDRAAEDNCPFVSKVVLNATTGNAAITFSRSLRTAEGGFDGIVMLSVDPSYFTSGYDALRMGDEGELMLLGKDGVVRAERIGNRTSWGAIVSTAAGRAGAEASSDLAQVNAWDQGVLRYANVRQLHGFPLLAIVGLAQDEQLARFRRDRRNLLWATAVGSLFLLVLALVLSRMSWELARSRARARRAQKTHYAAAEASFDAFFILRGERGVDGQITDFVLLDTNRRGVELCGLSRDLLIRKTLEAAFPDYRDNGMFDAFVSVAETGLAEEHEWVHHGANAPSVWLHRQVVCVDDGVVAIMRDISARKHAEVLRADENRVLEMVASSIPLEQVLCYLMLILESQIEAAVCVILLSDEDGQRLKLGAAPSLPESYAKSVNGLPIGPEAGPSGSAIYRREAVIVPDVTQNEYCQALMARANLHDFGACWSLPILSNEGSAHGALTLFVRDPHEPSAAEAASIAMATRIAGIAIERSQTEERIRYMANHDALTGLPNRKLLSDRLDQALQRAQRYRRGVTVIFIDLDHFKQINDSLGHRAGDELLKIMAHRMIQCVRPGDAVVRLGGDEFVIVLPDEPLNDEGIISAIEKLRATILDPVELNGQSYQITCSVGLASYPGDGNDAETLLTNADAAMYCAKKLGRNNYQFYTAEMNLKVHEKIRLQANLRLAIANDEFRLMYQPQIDLSSNTIFGVEALIRWDHPSEGLINPGTFIPLAEETGLIVSIGDWVLHTACRQNKAWQNAGMPHLTISINVSARQFIQKDWVARVAHALSESGLEAHYLELELTESLIMQDVDGAIVTMNELQKMGVILSIDDFGTGYSSLSALKNFPIVRLKIDQAFVRGLPDGEDDRAIVTAIISLGHKLNMKVLAEGVETDRQLDFLRDHDCREVQGYRFSQPISPLELEKLLREPFAWPEAAPDQGRPAMSELAL